jgi:hypothetical protein
MHIHKHHKHSKVQSRMQALRLAAHSMVGLLPHQTNMVVSKLKNALRRKLHCISTRAANEHCHTGAHSTTDPASRMWRGLRIHSLLHNKVQLCTAVVRLFPQHIT